MADDNGQPGSSSPSSVCVCVCFFLALIKYCVNFTECEKSDFSALSFIVKASESHCDIRNILKSLLFLALLQAFGPKRLLKKYISSN